MALVLVTAPATEPVTVAEARAHLRLEAAAGEPAPTAPTVALAGTGAGNVENGAHRYRVTFVTADGETDGGTISAAVTVADKTVNGKVALTAIPLGGSAVTSRKLYRTAAGGSTYLLLATLADNTTTTYTDNIADASLGAAAPSTNTTEDPLLSALILAAREHVEAFTRRALVTQTWDLKLDGFPSVIRVPRPPLQSITSISYIDSNGATQTWAAANYSVDTSSQPGRIEPAYGISYPTLRGVPNAVTIRFVAGYGAAAAVPQSVKQAILLFVAHLYENREPVSPAAMSPVPMAFDALLWPHRMLDERVMT